MVYFSLLLHKKRTFLHAIFLVDWLTRKKMSYLSGKMNYKWKDFFKNISAHESPLVNVSNKESK